MKLRFGLCITIDILNKYYQPLTLKKLCIYVFKQTNDYEKYSRIFQTQ